MNKLEKLIAKLCPNGIEYKSLGEIATNFYRGNGILRTQVTAEGTPCVRYGEIYTTYGVWFDECVSHTKLEYVHSPKWIEYGDILFAITGEKINEIGKSAAYVGHNKCLAGGDIVVMKHRQNPKFISYALATGDAQKQKSKGKVKSKVVHSSVPELKEVVIPLPPLAIQDEIVRMLDGMTGLIGEIEQELAARKQQYEWYRDKIKAKYLSGKVKRASLSDLFDFYNGYTPRKSNSAFWENGTVPWFRLEDIREHGRMLSDSIQHVTCAAVKGDLFPADSLIVSTSATIGEYALITKPALTNQRFVVLHPKSKFATSLDPRFLLCMGREIGDYCKANINQGNFASVDMGAFKKFMFPLPPLAEQKVIVRKLDGMMGLIDELERERNARKQQYEYYRDRLLTFKRAG